MTSPISKPSARYQIALTSVLSLNFGFVLFDRNATGFLLPFIQPELGLSNTQAGFLSSALSLTWALAAFGIGAIADRTGSSKRLLVGTTIAFSLCSFASGLAASYTVLLLTRMVMGVAEGGIMPVSQSLIESDVDERYRGLAMGVAQGLVSSLLGSFVAPVLLAPFAEAHGWRPAFFLAGAPGLLMAIVVAFVVRERAAPTSQARARAASERGSFRDMLSSFREVLRERNVLLCAILSTLLVSYLVVCWNFMPLFLTNVRGYDASTMGWLMGTLGISATLATFLIPGASDRIGRRGVMIVLPLLAVGLPLAALYYTGPVWILGAAFAIGWAVTGVFPLFMATVPAESVDKRYIAGALGVCMGAGELIGGVVSTSVAGYAADLVGLQAPLWIMSGLALVAAFVALGIRETAPGVLRSAAVVQASETT
ncbi:MAG TPA: MFS transporter [Steroidobacteraceae bacterium]|jgi:predicted MFS family arabinose efflux permease